MIEGAIEREGLDSLEAGTLDASDDDQDNQGGDAGSRDAGASLEGSTRVESPMPWEVLNGGSALCPYIRQPDTAY